MARKTAKTHHRKTCRWYSSDYRSKSLGRYVPVNSGWYLRHSWCFRLRKDLHFSGPIKAFQLRSNYLRRMRWERKWDGWSFGVIPSTQDSEGWKGDLNHAKNIPGRQHIKHACRCQIGQYLHWYHSRWVLQRHGSKRIDDGWFYFQMGRSLKRNLW